MQNPEHGIRLRSSARTSTGQVRENNEDNIHLWTHDPFVLAVVADGMGGAVAGEEASRLAVEAVKAGFTLPDQPELFDAGPSEAITERLRAIIQSANTSIVHKSNNAPELRGMGTTVTLAFIKGTYAIVGHVGDSRAYLVDGEDRSITQITSDHSFVEALLIAGHITPDQAEGHPMQHVLYRALGQAEDVDVDIYYQTLHVGDRLVLCSDGLTRHVKAKEIAEITLSEANPDAASQALIDLANKRGGEDNVSVIVVAVEQDTPSRNITDTAAVPSGQDDDETLILKGRQRNRVILDTSTNSNNPQNAVVTDLDAALDSEKMSAERLKDSRELLMDYDDEDTLPSLFTKHGLQPILDVHTPLPLIARREHQGEGRDTLMPDQ